MKTKLIILMFFISFGLSAQTFSAYSNRSLFTDQKAGKIGDVITVLVVESSQASNNAQTSAGRTSDISLAGSGSFGAEKLPGGDVGLQTGSDFGGQGATETRGMVRTKISAVVDTVYANGNLFISGTRKISINGEEQTVKIAGVIRPSDIQGQNTVESSNIAGAEITIEGSGMIDRAQSPGWLTKLFHWLF